MTSYELNDQYVLQNSVLATDYETLSTEEIPFYVKFNMAVDGDIRLCRKGFLQHESQEGSCLHVKTGALLSFNVKSNMKTIEEMMTTRQFAFKAAECAELCLADDGCHGFMFYHKVDGEPKMDDNCVFVQLPPGFDSSQDTIRVDGQLDVIDFYEREM